MCFIELEKLGLTRFNHGKLFLPMTVHLLTRNILPTTKVLLCQLQLCYDILHTYYLKVLSFDQHVFVFITTWNMFSHSLVELIKRWISDIPTWQLLQQRHTHCVCSSEEYGCESRIILLYWNIQYRNHCLCLKHTYKCSSNSGKLRIVWLHNTVKTRKRKKDGRIDCVQQI